MAERTDAQLMALIHEQETAATEAELEARIAVLSLRLTQAKATGDAWGIRNYTMRLDYLRTRVGGGASAIEAHADDLKGLRAEKAKLTARVAELEAALAIDDLIDDVAGSARDYPPGMTSAEAKAFQEAKDGDMVPVANMDAPEATDAAKKLALESGIPLPDVPHKGLRITKDDVTKHLDSLTGPGGA